ncbi:hypothetical protein CTEN210_17314 [Chaetoceros tenuissimus]|uniref:Uncharacterized protein n=1 Tax=Chaetoceros tenuissimus TaxID=426638 RepID=A0AAD3DAL0_9STRA|nr:hypothetical protein CTEN210_17314 [Chaetoceros tenuissimus]
MSSFNAFHQSFEGLCGTRNNETSDATPRSVAEKDTLHMYRLALQNRKKWSKSMQNQEASNYGEMEAIAQRRNAKRYRSVFTMPVILVIAFFCILNANGESMVKAFSTQASLRSYLFKISSVCTHRQPMTYLQLAEDGEGEEDIEKSDATDEEIIQNNQEEPIMLEDLNWRVNKMRLEEENKRRFLKSGPRHLPYEECRKWVIAFNRWENEQEWRQWIEDGEKRNSYIPSYPDEYYGKRGEWISWDHFLGKENELSRNEDDAFQ